MSTFPEFLRFRAGLLPEAGSMGLLDAAPSPAPSAAPAPAAAPQQPKSGTGFFDTVGRILGGVDDPRISPEENKRAKQQAIMQAGLAILGSERPGVAGIAEGAALGQAAGSAFREQSYGRTQQERVANALKDPELLKNMTPQQRTLIALLPPDQAVKAITEILSRAPQVVGDDQALIGQGGQVLYHGPGKEEPLPADLRAILWAQGTPPDALSPQQKVAALAEYKQMQPKGTQIFTGDNRKAMSVTDEKLYSSLASAADGAANNMESINLLGQLVENGMPSGGLEALTLPLRNIGASLGVTTDAADNDIAQQQLFTGIVNKLVLGNAEQLTGPKSDNDIKFLKSMLPQLSNTPEGNRLLVEVLRRTEQRKIELADMADAWAADHDNSLTGWRTFRAKWVREHPISYEDLIRQIPAGSPAWGTK